MKMIKKICDIYIFIVENAYLLCVMLYWDQFNLWLIESRAFGLFPVVHAVRGIEEIGM